MDDAIILGSSALLPESLATSFRKTADGNNLQVPAHYESFARVPAINLKPRRKVHLQRAIMVGRLTFGPGPRVRFRNRETLFTEPIASSCQQSAGDSLVAELLGDHKATNRAYLFNLVTG